MNNRKNNYAVPRPTPKTNFKDPFFQYLFENIHLKKKSCVHPPPPSITDPSYSPKTSPNGKTGINFSDTFTYTSAKAKEKTKPPSMGLSPTEREVNQFMKKYYKKIIIRCHPDKTKDLHKIAIFRQSQKHMEDKFIIGLLKNCFELSIPLTINSSVIVNKILLEIRVLQEKIIVFKNSDCWKQNEK